MTRHESAPLGLLVSVLKRPQPRVGEHRLADLEPQLCDPLSERLERSDESEHDLVVLELCVTPPGSSEVDIAATAIA